MANQQAARKRTDAGEDAKGSTLSEERIQRLDSIGFLWDKVQQSFEKYYEAACEFYQKEGHLNVPVKYASANGLKLGVWLRDRACRKDTLSKQQIESLDAIGMNWGSKYDAIWDERYQLATLYYKEHGDLKISQVYVAEAGDSRVWLGKWVAEQRKKKRKPRGRSALTKGQETRLEKIGMEW